MKGKFKRGKIAVQTVPIAEVPTADIPEIPSVFQDTIEGILSQLKNAEGDQLLTETQTQNLVDLTFSDDSKILYIESRWFIYEVANVLIQKGYEETYNWLSGRDWLDDYSDNFDEIYKQMIFNSPVMQSTRQKFQLDLSIYKTRVEAGKGDPCPRCGSEETLSRNKQTRSPDEPVSVFNTCISCGKNWRSQ